MTNDSSLIAAICDTAWGYLETGNEVFSAEGCTFIRDRTCPRRYDANMVTRTRCEPEAIDTLLARAEVEYAGNSHRRFATDPFTPPELVARLYLDGYEPKETVWLVLDGDLRPATLPKVEIRLLSGEEEWRASAELQAAEWTEVLAKRGQPPQLDVMPEFVASKRAKSPTIRHWLAWVDGVACAYFSSWEGKNGVGIVEDLFTLPDYRHRGIATALIHHCVADARGHGAGQVIIGALVTDTPKLMYANMGFRPFLTTRHFTLVKE